MAVYTSGGSSVHYGYETTFGTPVTSGSGAAKALSSPKTFGLNTSVNTLSIGTNRIDLNQLGQIEPDAFAYGQQAGTCDVSFTWDDTDSQALFQSIYGAPSGNTSGYVYPASSSNPSATTSPAVINSVSVQVDQQFSGAHTYSDGTTNSTATRIRRTLKGGVVTGLTLNTSIGQTVDGTCSISYGKEDTTDSTEAGGTIVNQTAITGKPLTFAHGTFKVSDGSGLRTLGEIQNVSVNFNTNTALLYELGSHSSVDAYRQVFEISGTFQTSFKDIKHLTHLLNQASKDVNEEGISDGSTHKNTNQSHVGAELKFTSGNKYITVELRSVSFGSHDISGLVPVQPVFEDLPFKALSARITTRTAA